MGGRRQVFVVRGRSMAPTLIAGDRVFVDPELEPELGSLVVARLADGTRVVKRLASRGTHSIALGSDNPSEASDSRQLGSLAQEALLGVVVLSWPWR